MEALIVSLFQTFISNEVYFKRLLLLSDSNDNFLTTDLDSRGAFASNDNIATVVSLKPDEFSVGQPPTIL